MNSGRCHGYWVRAAAASQRLRPADHLTTERPESEVHKYLLPHEAHILTTRLHPITFTAWITFAAAVTAITLWQATSTLFYPLAAATTALIARAAWAAFTWRKDWLCVTSFRVLLITGLLRRKVAQMPIPRVTDLSYERSLAGRIIGYGTFIFESAGQDQALREVDYIPHPLEVYQQICAALYPDMADDAGDSTLKMTEEMARRRAQGLSPPLRSPYKGESAFSVFFRWLRRKPQLPSAAALQAQAAHLFAERREGSKSE